MSTTVSWKCAIYKVASHDRAKFHTSKPMAVSQHPSLLAPSRVDEHPYLACRLFHQFVASGLFAHKVHLEGIQLSYYSPCQDSKTMDVTESGRKLAQLAQATRSTLSDKASNLAPWFKSPIQYRGRHNTNGYTRWAFRLDKSVVSQAGLVCQNMIRRSRSLMCLRSTVALVRCRGHNLRTLTTRPRPPNPRKVMFIVQDYMSLFGNKPSAVVECRYIGSDMVQES